MDEQAINNAEVIEDENEFVEEPEYVDDAEESGISVGSVLGKVAIAGLAVGAVALGVKFGKKALHKGATKVAELTAPKTDEAAENDSKPDHFVLEDGGKTEKAAK